MAWYHIPGPEQDVALLTEITCVRNIEALPFPAHMDAGGARSLIADVAATLEPNGFTDVGIADLPRTAAFSLAEKRYTSPDLITLSRPHALLIHEPCGLSVSLGGTDHMAITALRTGLALDEAYTSVYSVESVLDQRFELAFDERYGYLSADPALVGTGLSVTVVLCLPMMQASEHIDHLSQRFFFHGIQLTPLAPIGKNSMGALYRLSNTTTLGLSEEEVIGKLHLAARHLIRLERQLRASVSGDAYTRLTDRLRRSQAILQASPRLSVSEAVTRLCDLRLGASIGALNDIKVEALTVALMETMPACLALTRGEDERGEEALRGERVTACIRPGNT